MTEPIPGPVSPATHYLRCEGAIRPVCGTPHDVATTTDRARVTCVKCRGTFAYRHPRAGEVTGKGSTVNKTPTEYRQDQAARFAAGLGLPDGDALYRAAIAAWGNLNPQIFTFEGALSVAGVALAAARQSTWRKCRHCHAPVYEHAAQWAARPAGGQPVMFCPENTGGGHEPAGGDGQRRFILAADPVRYGHSRALMREVIEIDPAGGRSVFAAVPDSDAFDIQQLLGRAYDTGRDDARESAAQGWDDRDSGAADAAAGQAALDQARATRSHMRNWAAGEETHRGEAQEDA